MKRRRVKKLIRSMIRDMKRGPQGPTGYPGPQGNNGIDHVVIIDAEGPRLITREEFTRVFGDLGWARP